METPTSVSLSFKTGCLVLSALLCGYLASIGTIVSIDGPANPYPLTLYPGAVYGIALSLWFGRLKRASLLRAAVFVLCSMCVYRAAVWITLYFEDAPWWSMALAGAFGATLLGIASKLIALPISARVLLELGAIGALGGLGFYLVLHIENNPQGVIRLLIMATAYAVWQVPVGMRLAHYLRAKASAVR